MTRYCPYIGKYTDEKFTPDHVIPHCIGGSFDYSVPVSDTANSWIGSNIEAGLRKSPFIEAACVQHGVKSRSGTPEWKLRGLILDGNHKVEIVFRPDGSAYCRIVNSFLADTDSRTRGVIRAVADDLEPEMARFARDHERKGHDVVFGPEEETLNDVPVSVELVFDTHILKRALSKIAYAGLLHAFPDYVDDPLAPEWRELVMNESDHDALAAKIHGTCFTVDDMTLYACFSPLEPYEHAVSITRLPEGCEVLVGVSLFGIGQHHLVALASTASDYGLAPGEQRLAICNAKERSTRFETRDFVHALIEFASSIR